MRGTRTYGLSGLATSTEVVVFWLIPPCSKIGENSKIASVSTFIGMDTANLCRDDRVKIRSVR